MWLIAEGPLATLIRPCVRSYNSSNDYRNLESTVVAEPRTAGSNGAVIGGVVAVAAFVIIVAILLIARYFMSHKGLYNNPLRHSRKFAQHYPM